MLTTKGILTLVTCSQYVPVADLARTALEYAPAPIMERVILSTDPASVTLVGLVVTALSVSISFFSFIFEAIKVQLHKFSPCW